MPLFDHPVSQYDAVPAEWEMLDSEQWVLSFNMQPQCVGEQTPASPVSVLTDKDDETQTPITMPDDPGVTGFLVTQQVRGSQVSEGVLEAGHIYRLAVSCQLDDQNTTTIVLWIRVGND